MLWGCLAVPLAVEVAAAWTGLVQRVAELVVTGSVLAGMVLLRRSALQSVLCAAVAAATCSAVVFAPTASDPARLWPFAATAAFAYLLGRGPVGGRTTVRALVVVVVAALPVACAVDSATYGG